MPMKDESTGLCGVPCGNLVDRVKPYSYRVLHIRFTIAALLWTLVDTYVTHQLDSVTSRGTDTATKK